MSVWQLALRGMRHYWRTHLGVLLGIACATTVLVGALSVGDSVRLSLRDQALQRIGSFSSALTAGDRFVQADLADRMMSGLDGTHCLPAIYLPGIASKDGGQKRTGIVDVFGIEDQFFALSRLGKVRPAPPPGHAVLNERLATQLEVVAGDEIILRIEKPSLMPHEATMATVDDVSFGLRIVIDDIVNDQEFGRFGLRASQTPPFNVFVSLAWLQQELNLDGRANMLLVDGPVAQADAALAAHWTIADAELHLERVGDGSQWALTSTRVFLDPPIIEAVRSIASEALGVVTYFVNSLQKGDRSTPYSMVSAIGPLDTTTTTPPALKSLRELLPDNVGDNQVVCNEWLANDLEAAVGDTINMSYWVMNSSLQFEEREHSLKVHSIVKLADAAADPGLMPDFPGLSEAKSCREWEPGIPVDLQRLDDADQAYWAEHRGTPKAFVTLATGQELWSNRFGSLTAVRTTQSRAEQLARELPNAINPADLNLFFQDIRGPAIAAGEPATDFGQLYLGLSFFLIVAALLLAAMMFAFGVEQRQGEIGTLLAIGYEPRVVRGIFIREALLLATCGSVIGALLGAGYTHAVLATLDTLWRDTIGQTTLTAHIIPTSVGIGAGCAVVTALAAIAWMLRRAFRRPAVDLLSAKSGLEMPVASHRWVSTCLCVATLLGAVTIVATAETGRSTSAFFGGGALLLISALCACKRMLLSFGDGRKTSIASLAALGLRNTGRRPGRSLTTIALLASGTFLVVSIQANRLEPPMDPSVRNSGTGGFALFGRSTLPVLRDLQTEAGRDAYSLNEEELAGVSIVPLRVRSGDDASCLNLSTAQNPQLVGVEPASLAQRECFRFTRSESPEGSDENPWLLLNRDFGENVVPAIGDGGSVAWALHKSLGDSLTYRDEAGKEFSVRIVGTVADSILQGNLVISDNHLRERFPSASGYRMFLIDANDARTEQVANDLTYALEDIGLELTPTADRLASFQAVQNTYLMIFQLLGGLGLLLGTVGLGVVVLRNALERRGELAIARAIGFQTKDIHRLVFYEHGGLLGLGLVTGILAATLAILPALQQGRPLPITPIVILIGVLTISGLFWVWLASTLATRGRLMDGLRGE